jgi:hypothetical protein
MGDASHSRGGGPSGTAVGAAEEAGATRGAAVEAGATRGAAVGAARGRNFRRTVGAGRGATSGSNLRGTSGASWQGATIPAVVSRVLTVETVKPDSQRKSRPVRLNQTHKENLGLIKNHVSRDDQAVCGEIKATVAFVIKGVAKEDTPDRARSELMRRGCSSVRVTRAAENSEMII